MFLLLNSLVILNSSNRNLKS